MTGPAIAIDDRGYDTLVCRYLDGVATADELTALTAAMRGDTDRQRTFIELTLTRRTLHETLAGPVNTRRAAPKVESTVRAGAMVSSSRFRIAPAIFTAAAALLVVAAIVAAYITALTAPPTPSTPDVPVVATLTDASGVVWSSEPLNPGDSIRPQTIRTESGNAELMLTSGTQIDLSGPAELRLDSPTRVTLTRGAARFNCPHDAPGFTVHAPRGVSVVDLGTVFEVRVGDGGVTAVSVVEGSVELRGPRFAPIVIAAGGVRLVDSTDRIADLPEPIVRRMVARDALRHDPALMAWFDFDATPDPMAFDAGSGEPTPQRSPRDAVGVFVAGEGSVPIKGAGPADSFTCSVWARFDALPAGRDIASLLVSDVYYNSGVAVHVIGGQVIFAIATEQSAQVHVAADTPVQIGRWHHVAAVVDRADGQMRLYVDGRRAGELAIGPRVAVRLDAMTVGAYNPPPHARPGRYFRGRLADFALLNRAMTDDEILRCYRSAQPDEPAAVAEPVADDPSIEKRAEPQIQGETKGR